MKRVKKKKKRSYERVSERGKKRKGMREIVRRREKK